LLTLAVAALAARAGRHEKVPRRGAAVKSSVVEIVPRGTDHVTEGLAWLSELIVGRRGNAALRLGTPWRWPAARRTIGQRWFTVTATLLIGVKRARVMVGLQRVVVPALGECRSLVLWTRLFPLRENAPAPAEVPVAAQV